jgi:error-prone DNA polymerase
MNGMYMGSLDKSPDDTAGYAELHCLSNFSFLRGASQPQELVERAAELGYSALALTDECSVAGVVRAHGAAKELGLKFIVGSEFAFPDGMRLVALATNRNGYGKLCRLITRGRRAARKGSYELTQEDFAQGIEDCLVLLTPPPENAARQLRWFAERFPGRAWIAVELLCEGDDDAHLARLTALGAELDLPLVAAGNVHMHSRERRALHDVLTAIRHNATVAQVGYGLQPNGERHLRPLSTLRKLYPSALLQETLKIAQRCTFSLDELRYEYPDELVPAGHTPASWLRDRTEEGVRRFWPDGAPQKVRDQIEHELKLIRQLDYESYFLTVYELVAYARKEGILCQGRGSAANSAVCYCLGVTSVDPATQTVLFERFISAERNEPPDIDVDFEHERREEVIQHIYDKYGRQRAALAATVICYRGRSARRDVGMALGSPDHPMFPALVEELRGFPRHLSQHVGGFVISRGPLDELVPIENASMEGRTVIQWDKDDLESLKLLKVDVLALGMLTALKRAFDFYQAWYGKALDLISVPKEQPEVYDMICKADTIGVFQIESRAQMSMLPRLKPRKFASISAPARWSGKSGLSKRKGAGGAGAHPGRADFPGAGDAAGHRGGRFHARRRRSVAPFHGQLGAQGNDGAFPRPFVERDA